MKKYKVAKEFTNLPGGRYIENGDFSGEAFRIEVLVPLIKECLKNGEKLTIDFDGAYGYPPSFLEEAFGGLIRENNFSERELTSILEYVCEDEPSIKDKVLSYIKNAKSEIIK